MPAFEKLPLSRQASWGGHRQITYYRAMKAVHVCDAAELSKLISEWRTECRGAEYYSYLSYLRSWHYILESTDETWQKAVDSFDDYCESGELDTDSLASARCTVTTMLWCAAIRGDLGLAEILAGLAGKYGEPAKTIELALSLARRDSGARGELVPAAVAAVKTRLEDEFYAEFLEELFSEAQMSTVTG